MTTWIVPAGAPAPPPPPAPSPPPSSQPSHGFFPIDRDRFQFVAPVVWPSYLATPGLPSCAVWRTWSPAQKFWYAMQLYHPTYFFGGYSVPILSAAQQAQIVARVQALDAACFGQAAPPYGYAPPYGGYAPYAQPLPPTAYMQYAPPTFRSLGWPWGVEL